jgi:nucleoside-diphosphate-sugar epimerase
MRILVTGGTGFLGARLVAQLLADGHDVLALARSIASRERLEAMGATPVAGDLDAEGPIDLPAIDAVVHAAAHFRLAGPSAPYFRTNVGGTKALLRAAEGAGAHTFVHISAAGVVMDDRGSPIRDVDESMTTNPDSFSAYIASKSRGEAEVLAANRHGFRTIALRPPGIWGPGDMFSRELPAAIASGQFAFVGGGRYAYATCHVDNVVEAVQCALERGVGGRAYFVNDRERQTFRGFVSMIAGVQGLSTDKLRSMSYGLAFLMGRVMEAVWSIRGKEGDPPLSRSMVRLIGREFGTDDGAARQELGYVGRVSVADGLRMYREAGAR